MTDDHAPIAITGVGVASDRHHTADDLLDPAARAPGAAADRLRGELGRGYRYKDRATKLGVLAAIRALRDNGQDSPAATTGVVVSSNFGNLQTVCDTARVIHAEGAGATSPMDLPNASSNVIASTIAIHLGLRAPNVTLCNGAPSGLDALRWAGVLLRTGRAHRVVVVGTESATETAAALQDCSPDQLFDGAAALVVEQSTTAGALRVHTCCRGTDPADATVRALTAAESPPIDLWLGTGSIAAGAVVDPEQYLGRAGGALGVVQCVVAHRWLARHGATRALAVAGNAVEGAGAVVLSREEAS
ncbi:beta-ketoacyl synthase N-terminal-like domain-containing protein [Nocardia nova]|jgi:3-oxoacyl-[acyl-carrier-protein] synthase II|uniref:beta-ketoacyl synthase N-terminal-like domain-containing protein n=1 Tax=Nocardia nova TaxID=37330 RepID=UPI001895B5E8|nr:beta-ketoacyl synthase N-terminal-like domain-containing protein [Nocardia nova]MBF6150032.1 3-oxoacyl-ACP synthase [Nocardia nova]MDN2502087.1 3-oxoacyl-ACP synthase [Nocardia nova]